MPPFTIRIKKSVEKDLKQVPRDLIPSVLTTIESLESDPFPRNSGKIRGAEHFSRVRVGEYRIVYQVLLEEKVVTIFYIRHRSVAYRPF
jgi:mRNA interferase RelE/StbE